MDFDGMLKTFRERLLADVPAFTTDADPDHLWSQYLHAIPSDVRHTYVCRCCEHFIKRYGGLAYIGESGALIPVFWSGPSDDLSFAFDLLREYVSARNVTGQFLTTDIVIGTQTSREKSTGLVTWTHLHGVVGAAQKVRVPARGSLDGVVATKLHNFENVWRAYKEFKHETVLQAVTILRSDAIYRGERALGPGEFLLSVYEDLNSSAKPRDERSRKHRLWHFVATAPDGFCHPRSSMIGTLLEDLEGGVSVVNAKKKFTAKMHPLQYQRPQAPAKDGNIKASQKLIDDLGLAPAFKRRHATLFEINALWRPTSAGFAGASESSLFGDAISAARQSTPRALAHEKRPNMTAVAFVKNVLPNAESIHVVAPTVGPFASILGPVHNDNPQLFLWKHQFSWYQYSNGSSASSWKLAAGLAHQVNAVCWQPSMWDDPEGMTHVGKGLFFIIEGAKDTQRCGLGLFPEILRSELRSARSTIEEYSRGVRLEGADQQSASGILMQNSSHYYPIQLKVVLKNKAGAITFSIDRWE